MIYTVTSNQAINYSPANEAEDVIRNVHMILRVCKTEQPLMRDFSMDSDLIDKNIDVVENKIVGLLLNLLKKYEPRALLKQVRLEMLDGGDFEIMMLMEVMV